MASNTEENYHLSCEILGHSADVRAVCSFPVSGHDREHILTASRDGTACVWAPEAQSPTDYVLRKVFRQHTGYVSALCVIPTDLAAGRTAPLVVTGGQDQTILVHSLEEGVDEPLERYVGHTALVTCIIHQHGQLISASWDSTIRVWKSERLCDKMEAHKPAVWSIAGLFSLDGTKRVLSGGADRAVRLWELETKVCVQEYRGHADVVRDVKVTSRDTFLSAANDCTIRKWNIHSGQCLREIDGHQAFVYSLSVFTHGVEDHFASCGEDSSLRVWKRGECQQVVYHPATSVWTVWCMDNGDIITGSSDGVARVFSACQARKAAAELQASYDSRVRVHRSAGGGSDIDVKSLPGLEALDTPGRKEGQTLMINKDGIPEVYQWSEDMSQWIKIGDAIGQAPQSSSVYQGKEYDHVFDIELDEGSPTMRKLKLPYNNSTDPFIAAEEFLEANNLPMMYLDQVAEFIVKNAGEYSGPPPAVFSDPFTGGTRYIPQSAGRRGAGQGGADPFTGGSRYVPGSSGGGALDLGTSTFPSTRGADPFTGGSSYQPESSSVAQPQFSVSFKGLSNPYFPMSSFKTFTSPEDYGGKVIAKIREFNAAVGREQSLTEEQLTGLEGLCRTLTSSVSASAPVGAIDLEVIEAMMRWPPEYVFPGLDLLRLAVLNDYGCQHFIRDGDTGRAFLRELFALAVGSQAQSKNQLLVLRTLANMFCKDTSAQLLHSEREWILSQLEGLLSTGGKPNQVALATILQNYCHYYGLTKSTSDIGECVVYCVKVLQSPCDNEAKFRVLVGIGSLAVIDKALVVSSAQPSDLSSLIQPLCSVVEPAKVSQCAELVLQALR